MDLSPPLAHTRARGSASIRVRESDGTRKTILSGLSGVLERTLSRLCFPATLSPNLLLLLLRKFSLACVIPRAIFLITADSCFLSVANHFPLNVRFSIRDLAFVCFFLFFFFTRTMKTSALEIPSGSRNIRRSWATIQGENFQKLTLANLFVDRKLGYKIA